MRAVWIIIGLLGGLYAIGGIVQFVGTLAKSNPGSTYGQANIAASFVPICIGLIVCIACLQKAFKRKSQPNEDEPFSSTPK